MSERPHPDRQLVVPADADAGAAARLAVEQACASALAPEPLFGLCLAVDELLTNAVTHGQRGGPFDAPIALTITTGPDHVTVEIRDPGPPFNPLADAPPPVLDGAIEDRPLGGLGIHLVRSFVEDISYHRTQGRNVVRLTVPRAGHGGL